MKNIFVFTFFSLIVNSGFARTRLHCFEISGTINSSFNYKPIINTMFIFRDGNKVDTVFTDSSGNYKYEVYFWPPCDKKNNKKFWKSERSILITCTDKLTTILYRPKQWARLCEGEKIPERSVMRKDMII